MCVCNVYIFASVCVCVCVMCIFAFVCVCMHAYVCADILTVHMNLTFCDQTIFNTDCMSLIIILCGGKTINTEMKTESAVLTHGSSKCGM